MMFFPSRDKGLITSSDRPDGSGSQLTAFMAGSGVKLPGSEADRVPPFSAEVKETVDSWLHYPL